MMAPRGVGQTAMVVVLVVALAVAGSAARPKLPGSSKTVFFQARDAHKPPAAQPAGQRTPVTFHPLCVNSTCSSPTELYPTGDARNFPPEKNLISRSTPDGVNKWPYKCLYRNCTVYEFDVLPRQTWWDDFEDSVALPTNTWFNTYFNNCPYNTNPAGWAWPVYQEPFATLAANKTFRVGWPPAQEIYGRVGLLPDMPVDANYTSPTAQVTVTRSMFAFATDWNFTYAKKITTYDENGLGVTLQYKSTNTSGTMSIPVFKGAPYLTVVYNDLSPVIYQMFGNIDSVNGKLISGATTIVYPKALNSTSEQIWYYDIVLTYNYQPSFTFRLYSTLETSFAVSTPPPHSVDERGWWSMQALSTCNGACVFRLACTQNVYLDSTYPSPFYSGTTVGGNFDISTAVLDKYVNVYPMQSTPKRAGVEFVKTADGWDTDFSWETSCMDPMAATCSPSNLLMMALPHHQDVMTAPSSTVPGSIPTMQGVAKLVVGDTWTLSYSTDDIVDTVLDNDPFYARVPINEEYTATLVSQLETDVTYWINDSYANQTFFYGDCYSFGKSLAILARLALVADELGETATARSVRDNLKLRLNEWFDPRVSTLEYPFKESERLVYDTVWGGLIPYDGLLNIGSYWLGNGTQQSEFGSGGYNDHLFHYGYYLYSVAAVLTSGEEADVTWFKGIESRVLAMARDIANPNQDADPYFATFRYKNDWYAGHSWALGLFPTGGAPNIESTSECINAWYGIYLLGYAINETLGQPDLAASLMDVGSLLLVTDMHAFDFYTHTRANYSEPDLPAVYKEVYPERIASLGLVGNEWAGLAIYSTFFSYSLCEWIGDPLYNPEYCSGRHLLSIPQLRFFNELFILSIQVLPFTPITPALANADWLASSYDTPAVTFTDVNGTTTSFGYSPVGKVEDMPDFFGKCTQPPAPPNYCASWVPYSYQIYALTSGAAAKDAFSAIGEYNSVAQGSSLTNALWFAAVEASANDHSDRLARHRKARRAKWERRDGEQS